MANAAIDRQTLNTLNYYLFAPLIVLMIGFGCWAYWNIRQAERQSSWPTVDGVITGSALECSVTREIKGRRRNTTVRKPMPCADVAAFLNENSEERWVERRAFALTVRANGASGQVRINAQEASASSIGEEIRVVQNPDDPSEMLPRHPMAAQSATAWFLLKGAALLTAFLLGFGFIVNRFARR